MLNHSKLCLTLSCFLLTALPGAASSITSVSFTPTSSPFTTDLTNTSTSSQVSISGTILCPITTTAGCSGEVGSFALGLDLTSLTPISADISGTLSEGSTSAPDSVKITFPIAESFPFSIDEGSFDQNIFSIKLPALGNLTVDGVVDLSLAAGQSIDLPLNFTVGTPTTVPEPSTVFLLGGLLAAFPLLRRARAKFSSPW
jgi:hypothetical protein